MSYGLDITKQEADLKPETDWVFGAVSQPCLYSIPGELREQYLPAGELQFGREDFNDCTTRSPLNMMEAKFTYAYQNHLMLAENRKWLEDNGYVNNNVITFSDRFNAILSGTLRTGNSVVAPIHSIHSDGMIPKYLLPRDAYFTFDDYMNRDAITPAMIDLGLAFAARFTINYELVYAIHFKDALKDDMLCVAGYGWPKPIGNIYPDPGTSQPFNHAFLNWSTVLYKVFDNYLEYIKQLAPNYTLYNMGYRVFISSEQVADPMKNELLSNPLVIAFLRLLRSLNVTMGGVWDKLRGQK